MALPTRRTQEPRRPLPSLRGWTRKFSSFLRFQQYRSDTVSVSTVIVALDGTGDFDDIQAAIDSLPDTGGEILIKAGDYTISSFILVTKSNVSIRGVGRATNIISGTAAEMLVFASVSNVQVSNILFTGFGDDLANLGIVFSTVTNSSIKNCFFENMGNNTISLATSDENVIDSNRIGVTFAGTGIIITDCDNNVISNNYIDGNVVSIGLITSNNNTITNNKGVGSKGVGVFLQTSNNNVVSNNDFSNQLLDGIKLESSDNNSMLSNNINGGGGFGINVSNAACDNNIISGNNLFNNFSGSINDDGTLTEIGHNNTDSPIS